MTREPAPTALLPRAVFSDCRLYRYVLRRSIESGLTFGWGKQTGPRRITWIMLNPSTADATTDDPTIRRCRNYSWGFGGEEMEIVNLYAYRSRNPRDLSAPGIDPVGPRNDEYIRESVRLADVVMCGWGQTDAPGIAARVEAVLAILGECGRAPLCLGVTKFGDPLHPLYLAKSRRPVELSAARAAQ